MGEDNEKSEGSHCPCQSELKYESKDMKKNKTVSRITVNTTYSKHKPQRVEKGDKSLGSCWGGWLQKHRGQVTFWHFDILKQSTVGALRPKEPICHVETHWRVQTRWPSSSRLCANFITISVEPLLHTLLFYRNPALLCVHVIGRSEAQTSQTRRMKKESSEVRWKRQT